MIDWTFDAARAGTAIAWGVTADELRAGMDDLARVMRQAAEATRQPVLEILIAFAPLTGDRSRMHCTCGARPRAIDWQRHTTKAETRRRPWRAGREHRPS